MRVTVDLDSPRGLKLIEAYYCLGYFSGGRVLIRRSAKRPRGWHLKAHGLPPSDTFYAEVRLRYGDDKNRVRFDLTRKKKPKQILWTEKDGEKASKWRVEPWTLLMPENPPVRLLG